MKKLIILILILSITSVTNASLYLSLDGTTEAPATRDIVVGGSEPLYVVSTDTTAYRTYWDMLKGLSTLTMPTVIHNPPTSDAGNIAGVADFSTGSLYDYECTAASNLQPTDIIAGAHFLATLTATGSVGETFLVEILGGDSPFPQIDGIEYTIVVPEPMTLSLLGLGGLLLRRRFA